RQRGDAGVEARQLAGDGVLVEDALRDAAMHLGLGGEEGGLGRGLVAAGDRLLDLLDESLDAALAGAVHHRALLGLADAFLGGFMGGHRGPLARLGSVAESAAYIGTPGAASSAAGTMMITTAARRHGGSV